MSETVRISFPAKADYLLLARLALGGIAREVDISEELLADLKLAVTEACGNAVRHAYPNDEGNVTVVYTLDGDTFEMTVEDHGIGVEATSARQGAATGPTRGDFPRPASDRAPGPVGWRTLPSPDPAR